MIYTNLASASAAGLAMNSAPGHAPAAVYWDHAGNGYTILRAWQHGDRRGLRLVLRPARYGASHGWTYVTLQPARREAV